MGNCCSPGSEVDPPDFPDSTPVPQGPATPQIQPQAPILSNNSIDYKALGQTLDHISDREGE